MLRQGSGGVVVCLLAGLVFAIGCGGEPPGAGPPPTATSAATAPLVSRSGVRFDMSNRIEHVRALKKQPDGTYRSVCIDGADALRPAGDQGAKR